jgi:hypothetical protein
MMHANGPMALHFLSYHHHPEVKIWLKAPKYLKKLIPWSRILLEQQTVAYPLKKLQTLYGTQRFSTVFIRAQH